VVLPRASCWHTRGMNTVGRPVIVVAAAIVDDLKAPRVLLAARRCTPARLAGRWEFPGGKVDPGETAQEALHRELYEELGVRVRLGAELAGPANGVWPLEKRYVMRLWLATVESGTPRPLVEHDEVRWLPMAQCHQVHWLDADLPIVDALAVALFGGN